MTEALPTLPTGSLDLLAKAALAPPEVAQEAWRIWRQGYTLDETPWNEVRLLGAVAERIDWLEPEAGILPRMRGIQKFLYAQTQMCLMGSVSALQALVHCGIPVMLIKGAARVATDARLARERLVRDLDVLVPIENACEAFAVLQTQNWTFQNHGAWQTFWHQLDPIANHHAWSLSRSGVEVDLHHFSNSINRLADDDRGLWRRARPTLWRGMTIYLPAPEDSLILSIVHGLRWSRECNADWIIDACSCLQTARIDWQLLVDEAHQRQIDALLLSGLQYIKHAIRSDIPEDVLVELSRKASQQQWKELEVYARVPMPKTPDQNRPVLAMAVDRCGQSFPTSAPRIRCLHKLRTSFLPLRASIRIETIAPGAESVDLIIRVYVSCPVRTRLVGTICLVGLVLDCKLATPQGGGDTHDFQFSFPRRLLERRGVTSLCLSIEFAERFNYPPWVHDFRSGSVFA